MITSRGKILLATMSLVLITQWIDAPLVVGGKPVVFISELVLYFHAIVLLVMTGGRLNIPKRIVRILVPLIIYFVLHLIYSVLFVDAGNAILTTRRLVYYPFLSIVIGYSTAVATRDSQLVEKALMWVLYLSLPLIMLNVALRFHMFQEFGFVSRASGVIVSAILFRKMLDLIRFNRLTKRDAWIGVVTFLLVFVTSSRGVYLAFISTTALLVWQWRKRVGLARFSKLAVGGLAGIGIIAAIAISSPLVTKTLQKFSTDIANISEGNMGSYGDKFNTLGARYYLYRATFELGMESPIFGNGSGYKVEEWHLGGSYNVERSKTPHNYYLDIWYRLGIIGLILFFLFYRNVLRELKKRQENVYYMLIMALIYSSFDVMLSSTTSAIIPIFLLVGASLRSPELQLITE